MQTCCVCGDPVFKKGFCRMHYDRQRRGADMAAPRQHHFPKGTSAYDKVIALSVRDRDCLVFVGARDPNGYGHIGIPGTDRSMLAHRAVAEHSFGPIAGKIIYHTCDNPPCVNIDHLRVGTHSDNMRDAMSKGRMRGLFQPRLSDADVAAIRADPRRQVVIAAEYSISPSHVSKIKSGHVRRLTPVRPS